MGLGFIPTEPWRPTGMLTATRTRGSIGLNKNGTFIDIWLRVDGEAKWFSVEAAALRGFLASEDAATVLWCESDGNAEAV